MKKAFTLKDLNVLKLEDQSVYNHYAHHSSCPVSSWWAHFPYFWGYSLKKKRQSLWTIIDGLFIPFIFSGKYLSILCIPFGDAPPDIYIKVLKKCLDICSLQNGDAQNYTYVKWVTEDQEQFLRQSADFAKLFKARQRTSIGPEYHYSIKELVKLEGKHFAYIRRKINKLKKDHPDVVIRRYVSSDYPHLLELNDKWLTEAENRLGTIFDRAYYPVVLKCHDALDHIILVAAQKGCIVGMISGARTPNGQSYCFLRKSLRIYSGLPETLTLALVHAIHEQDSTVELLNDGGTGLRPGLVHFKAHFRPQMLMNRSILYINSLRVLQKSSYRGTSIVGYCPSGRLVFAGGQSDLFRDLPVEDIQHLNMFITRALGADAKDIEWKLEKCPAKIIAQIAVILQQAARHPVKAYGARKTAAGTIEVYFELLRPELLQPLIDSLQAFYQSGILRFNENLFVHQYQSNRAVFAFRLSEFIVWDRITTAHRLGIEAWPGEGSKIWVGQGPTSRLTSMGYTQNTSRLAKKIAGNKVECFKLLQEKGLPLPKQIEARSEHAAVKAALTIGYPVVVKPRRGSKGVGVAVNISTDKGVSDAYAEASKIEKVVVVESFIPGEDYRLLVVNGRFIAAVKRIPAKVVGDGHRTIKELMEITNRRERRDGLYLYPLKVDSEVLRLLSEQNKHLDSKPEKGQLVWLRKTANVSLGGTMEDVTVLVHPDNRAAAVSSAKACLLDVAGIDFISTDISVSWRNGYGKIIEINAGPGGDLHMQPTTGSPRDVSYHMIRSHIPACRSENHPTIIISGRVGKTSVAGLCSWFYSKIGMFPGILLKNRLMTGCNSIPITNSFFDQLSILNRHSELDVSIVAQSMKVLATEGLSIERVTCAVLTDDGLHDKFSSAFHDPNIARRIYGLLADMATHGVVIDGQSAILDEAVSHLPPENIVKIWATPYRSIPTPMKKHLERGGRALGVSGSGQETDYQLSWYENNSCTHVISFSQEAARNIKPLMMAIGTLLLSTTSLERLRPILKEKSNLGEGTSFNSLVTDICPIKGTRLACAMPGDIDAMDSFCEQTGTKGRIWLVASDKPGMFAEWKTWKNNLPDKRVYSMLETECGQNEKPFSFQAFHSLRTAWHQALNFARKDDTVILLVTDTLLRKQIFNSRQKHLTHHQSINTAPLWSAETLAEIFQGTWINGPSCGWGANRIGWGRDMVGADMVTILPGYPEQKDAVPGMLKELETVMKAGSRAVVSPVISNRPPRWKSVMQTDDPLGGCIRLGDHARQRLRGLIIALCAPPGIIASRLVQIGNILSTRLNQSVYFSPTLNNSILDDVVPTALTLANAEQNHSIYLFPWESINPLTGQMLRPDLVVIDGTNNSMLLQDNELLFCLNEETVIYILTEPDKESRWHKIAGESLNKINLFVASPMHTDHKEDWERIAVAITKDVSCTSFGYIKEP